MKTFPHANFIRWSWAPFEFTNSVVRQVHIHWGNREKTLHQQYE